MRARPLTSAGSLAPVVPPRLSSWLPHFVAIAAMWGSSFLFIKVGVRELHPVHVTLLRCAVGALTLLVVLLVRRDRLPRGWRVWAHLAVIAFIGNVVPFTLLGYGEQRVSSIIAGILNATTPLMVLVVALSFLPEERPTVRRVGSLCLGFAGVLIVLGVWNGMGAGTLVGQLACAGAAVCYGFAFPYTRRVVAGRPESGVAFAATQFILATAELTLIAPALAGAPPAPKHLSLDVVSSVLALGALGTGIAFWFNYRVIRIVGATTSASVTYLVPIFSTLLGVMVLGERMHWYEPLGAVVILAAVALSQAGSRSPPR